MAKAQNDKKEVFNYFCSYCWEKNCIHWAIKCHKTTELVPSFFGKDESIQKYNFTVFSLLSSTRETIEVSCFDIYKGVTVTSIGGWKLFITSSNSSTKHMIALSNASGHIMTPRKYCGKCCGKGEYIYTKTSIMPCNDCKGFGGVTCTYCYGHGAFYEAGRTYYCKNCTCGYTFICTNCKGAKTKVMKAQAGMVSCDSCFIPL